MCVDGMGEMGKVGFLIEGFVWVFWIFWCRLWILDIMGSFEFVGYGSIGSYSFRMLKC